MFVLHLLRRGRLFGCYLLYPPAAPVGWASLGSLLRSSVPLASCRTLSFCCFSPGFLPLAFVQAWVWGLWSWFWILPSFWGGSLSLVLVVLAWLFQLFCCPVSLGFLGIFVWFLSSRLPVFAGSPWLSALRCLAAGMVNLFFCQAYRLALVGLRCLWVPRSWGVQGLRVGATCLRSGLCSSSVRDRNEDYPSFWWDWFRAFTMGSPVSGLDGVLQPAIVP